MRAVGLSMPSLLSQKLGCVSRSVTDSGKSSKARAIGPSMTLLRTFSYVLQCTRLGKKLSLEGQGPRLDEGWRPNHVFNIYSSKNPGTYKNPERAPMGGRKVWVCHLQNRIYYECGHDFYHSMSRRINESGKSHPTRTVGLSLNPSPKAQPEVSVLFFS